VADGGIGDALVKFIIAKLGQSGIKGLREEPISPGAEAELDALLSGKVDVVVGTPPECIEAIRHGCKYLIDFAEYGFNYALGGIAARRAYVEQNPQITRQFVRAYVEGMHRYRSDREFTVDVQAEYSGIEDRTIAEETYDLTVPGMPRAPYPVVASLQALLDFMGNELPQAKGADAGKFVDDRFIRELEESGFIASLRQ
jgi:ABC-type nitrate/sulfonate/bicarbonate transport system substrate-binding protein